MFTGADFWVIVRVQRAVATVRVSKQRALPVAFLRVSVTCFTEFLTLVQLFLFHFPIKQSFVRIRHLQFYYACFHCLICLSINWIIVRQLVCSYKTGTSSTYRAEALQLQVPGQLPAPRLHSRPSSLPAAAHQILLLLPPASRKAHLSNATQGASPTTPDTQRPYRGRLRVVRPLFLPFSRFTVPPSGATGRNTRHARRQSPAKRDTRDETETGSRLPRLHLARFDGLARLLDRSSVPVSTATPSRGPSSL